MHSMTLGFQHRVDHTNQADFREKIADNYGFTIDSPLSDIISNTKIQDFIRRVWVPTVCEDCETPGILFGNRRLFVESSALDAREYRLT